MRGHKEVERLGKRQHPKRISKDAGAEATFKYKCRLCEKVFGGGTTSENFARMILLHIIYGLDPPEIKVGSMPEMIELHAECEKGVGVADLLGHTIIV